MKSPAVAVVVDAGVGRAAGPDPKERPWSDAARACHDILNALYRGAGFRAVLNEALWSEWKAHAGETGTAWLARMVSARRVVFSSEANFAWLVALIDQHLSATERPPARKDRHLVGLAVAPGDGRVVSGDDRARRLFARIPDPRVAAVLWASVSAATVRWLKEGAPPEPALRLAGPNDP